MIVSSLLVVGCVLSHTSAARLLPASLKLAAPSIGWFLTSIVLHARLPTVSLLVLGLQGVVAAAVMTKLGVGCALATRVAYLPLVSGVLGIAVAAVMARVGASAGFLASLLVLGMQLWALAGGTIMLAVYPASVVQVLETQETREMRYRAAARLVGSTAGKTVERSVTVSISGLQLDTVIVRQTRVPTDRWLLHFGGNAEFLENTLDDVSQEADLFGANLILYNPRGVGRSNGYVSQVSDLVEDAAAVSQFVVSKEKIHPRKLILLGHSIGGGIAAQVAYRVFPEATLVLDRTFSALCDAACSFSPFTPAVTQVLFPLLVGDLNSMEAWNGLLHERKLILFSRTDGIIAYYSSSIARLPQFQARQPGAKYVIELHGPRTNVHNVAISDFDERTVIASYVKRLLD